MGNWNIEGNYFETCNCESVCPCIFLSDPTENICEGIAAWQISKGIYEDTELVDRNVCLMYYSEGNMYDGDITGALYLDERCSDKQEKALTAIFGGQAGGFFGILAELFGEVIGVKKAHIKFNVDGKERTFKIKGIAEGKVMAMEGPNSEDITISNAPLVLSPGFPSVVAKSSKVSYDDYGYKWEISGKNALYAPFNYHD